MLARSLYLAKQKLAKVGQSHESPETVDDLTLQIKNLDTIKNTVTETKRLLKPIICLISENGKRNMPNPLKEIGDFLENDSLNYESDSLLNMTLLLAGNTFQYTGSEYEHLNKQLHEEVRKKLEVIIEDEIKKLDKNKKSLLNMKIDLEIKDSKRKATAVTHPSYQQKESEVHQMTQDLENSEDVFLTSVLNFNSNQKKFSESYLDMLKFHRQYHQNCLELFETKIESLEMLMNETIFRPVFKLDLKEYESVFGTTVSYVIKSCVDFIETHGLDEEGIFRLSGPSNKICKLKAQFNAGIADLSPCKLTVDIVASCLKTYLRELPEPILTFKLERDFIALAKYDDFDRLAPIKSLVQRLPEMNFINLKYIMDLLAKITKNSGVNKMNEKNLSIVIGPNLIWQDETDEAANDIDMSIYSKWCAEICFTLLKHHEEIFAKTNSRIDRSNSQSSL